VNRSLAALPAVHRVLAAATLRAATAVHGHARVREAARQALTMARQEVTRGGNPPSVHDLVSATAAILDQSSRAAYPEVINATGVLIHTNLGRAPCLVPPGASYLALELDLETGGRGERLAPITERLTCYFGTVAAMVVSNNAAALVLLLAAHAAGREVIVSRGELIEIGGSFRLPEIMAAAGTRLVEVGCTNRTRTADYEAAIGDATAGILVAHRSNFHMEGFVATPAVGELAAVARRRGVPLWVDQGSGCHVDLSRYGLRRETTVRELLAEGADAVLFSGDKLLAAPQAGIIVGSAPAIAPLRRHPLRRALRPDKAALAGLAATLDAYLAEQVERVPLYGLLAATDGDLRRRALKLARHLASQGVAARAVATRAVLGGGTTPDQTLPSWAVALPGGDDLARRLRRADPPLIGRVAEGHVLLDLRAVFPAQDPQVRSGVIGACGSFQDKPNNTRPDPI
jgi:L-seryl-tRNA(Ser) seleniumtransferase